MVNKILFYPRLALLCFKLSLSLFLFSLNVLWIKFNQKKLWLSVSATLLLLIWLSNFYIFHKKNTPQVQVFEIQILEKDLENSLLKERVLLTKTQAEKKFKNYEEIEQLGVQNLKLYLNLSQISQILENESQSRDYLNKAKTIAPHFKYLEN